MSKQYQEFKRKIDAFYSDCEFAEYITNYHQLLRDSNKKGFYFRKNRNRYPIIANVESAQKRKEITRHLCRTIYSSFIKDLYEEVCLYIKGVMLVSAEKHTIKNIDRFIGDAQKSVEVKKILNTSSFDQIIDNAISIIFRSMEEKAVWLNDKSKKMHLSIIKQLQNKLDFKINKTIEEEAMPYLELRHVLVHHDGIPDSDFIKKHACFSLRKGEKRLRITHQIIKEAYNKVHALVGEIDKQLELCKLI